MPASRRFWQFFDCGEVKLFRWGATGRPNRREYTGNDYLPHDCAVKSFETGLTRLETLTKAGRKPVHVPLAKVEDRIHAAQLVLPKCRFDSTKCEQGLAALREFRRDWDDKQKIFKDSPRHDWASHAADAFTYLAMGWRQGRNRSQGRRGHCTNRLVPISASTGVPIAARHLDAQLESAAGPVISYPAWERIPFIPQIPTLSARR